MSDHAMAWTVVSMGCSMLYILEQRLQAQHITNEKSQRVLFDVAQTMFSDRFLAELFKPQRMYSMQSTRHVFDKLAHSSIVRLNTSSMDKLYDLMIMATKYQALLAPHPSDLLIIAQNHLQTLGTMMTSADSKKIIGKTLQLINGLYSTFSSTEFVALRQTILRFFQDRRVKVSLFLQEKLQNNEGNIIVHAQGQLPPHVAIPGAIKYYEGGKVVKEEHISLKNAADVYLFKGEKTELGYNLYAKERKKKSALPTVDAAGITPSTDPIVAPEKFNKEKPVPKEVEQKTAEENEQQSSAVKKEWNLLADLIAPSTNTKNDHIDILSLFPRTELKDADGQEREDDVIIFDDAEAAHRQQMLQRKIDEWCTTDTNDEDDDLLAMMDSVSV
jgi:hypothetical protein